MRFMRATKSRNSSRPIQARRRTTSCSIRATWAAGPPKLVRPSRPISRTTSISRPGRDGDSSCPEADLLSLRLTGKRILPPGSRRRTRGAGPGEQALAGGARRACLARRSLPRLTWRRGATSRGGWTRNRSGPFTPGPGVSHPILRLCRPLSLPPAGQTSRQWTYGGSSHHHSTGRCASQPCCQ